MVTTHCTELEDEGHTETGYARGNRSQELAITNNHAGIEDMPIIKEEEAGMITNTILAMIGINQKNISKLISKESQSYYRSPSHTKAHHCHCYEASRIWKPPNHGSVN